VEMTKVIRSDLLTWTRLGDRPLSIRTPADTRLAASDQLWLDSSACRSSPLDAESGLRLWLYVSGELYAGD
jgi:hypothetical protein